MRLLDRLRPGPDPIEVDMFAVVGGLVLGPDRLHGFDPLAHDGEAPLWVRAVILHLLDVPAGSHAEEEPAAGEAIERGDLLRGDDRVALDDEADAGGEEYALGRGGRRGQRDERVVGVAVLPRELPARGIVGATDCRDVRVLREEQRLEAPLL